MTAANWSQSRRRGINWIFFLCVLLTGCSSKGMISGRVTYQGKPLPSGSVVFVPANGHTVTAPITDGRYQVKGIAVGTAKIGVQTFVNVEGNSPARFRREIPKGMGPPKDAMLPAGVDRSAFDPAAQRSKNQSVPIPEKYRDPEKSGLTCTVKGGAQEHDINLE